MKQWPYFLAGIVLVGACGLAYALRPSPVVDVRSIQLERQIPSSFGQWQEVQTSFVQMDLAPRGENGVVEANQAWPYDQIVSRTYRRSDGEVVMLSVAWGSKQRQEVKIHRPELCYSAQGFQVLKSTRGQIHLGDDKEVATTRLVTRSPSRTELVTYWIRIGEETSSSAWKTRLQILEEGLKGKIPDGILVRVSQALPVQGGDANQSYLVQSAFVKDLVANVDTATVKLLVGSAGS
jgi:EpsI family protein